MNGKRYIEGEMEREKRMMEGGNGRIQLQYQNLEQGGNHLQAPYGHGGKTIHHEEIKEVTEIGKAFVATPMGYNNSWDEMEREHAFGSNRFEPLKHFQRWKLIITKVF